LGRGGVRCGWDFCYSVTKKELGVNINCGEIFWENKYEGRIPSAMHAPVASTGD